MNLSHGTGRSIMGPSHTKQTAGAISFDLACTNNLVIVSLSSHIVLRLSPRTRMARASKSRSGILTNIGSFLLMRREHKHGREQKSHL
jgi:hypothetical protein